MGRPTRSVASWSEAAAAVSAADVHEVAKAALASSLFVLPPGRQPHRAGFTDAGLRSAPAVTGHRIRSADHPLNREWLVIGDDGVSLAQGQTISTVRFADCAALLTWPDGARELIGRDAVTIRIEPTLWRAKDRTAHLGDKVAADRRVDMPARAGQQVPRPWTRRRTRVAARMLVHPLAAALAGVIPALALLILLTRFVRGAAVIAAAVAFPALIIAVSAARFARARLLRRAAAHNTAHNTTSQS